MVDKKIVQYNGKSFEEIEIKQKKDMLVQIHLKSDKECRQIKLLDLGLFVEWKVYLHEGLNRVIRLQYESDYEYLYYYYEEKKEVKEWEDYMEIKDIVLGKSRGAYLKEIGEGQEQIELLKILLTGS